MNIEQKMEYIRRALELGLLGWTSMLSFIVLTKKKKLKKSF
jgi:hypothetical protein